MDWAALRNSGKNLRGIDYPGIIRVTEEELKAHKRAGRLLDCVGRACIQPNTLYPSTPEVKRCLMAIAGKDGTGLFMRTHSWVNFENMLDRCLVGVYVPN